MVPCRAVPLNVFFNSAFIFHGFGAALSSGARGNGFSQKGICIRNNVIAFIYIQDNYLWSSAGCGFSLSRGGTPTLHTSFPVQRSKTVQISQDNNDTSLHEKTPHV